MKFQNLPEQASEEAFGRVELFLGLCHQGQGFLLVLTHDEDDVEDFFKICLGRALV